MTKLTTFQKYNNDWMSEIFYYIHRSKKKKKHLSMVAEMTFVNI